MSDQQVAQTIHQYINTRRVGGGKPLSLGDRKSFKEQTVRNIYRLVQEKEKDGTMLKIFESKKWPWGKNRWVDQKVEGLYDLYTATDVDTITFDLRPLEQIIKKTCMAGKNISVAKLIAKRLVDD
jgi:hypothetical protein